MKGGIVEGLAEVREDLRSACKRSGRDEGDVKLIAVSKTFSAEAVREAIGEGQRVFGESRLQEAEGKLADVAEGIEWHFIGGVQRNKVRKILPLFEWVHGVDSLRLANTMDRTAADLGIVAKIFLQVDLAGEDSKGGYAPDVLHRELDDLSSMGNLEIGGLMTIPPATGDGGGSRRWFSELREFRDQLERNFKTSLPYLSMGMSGDYELAVEEGATHVRVGSAIFGRRNHKVRGESAGG